MRLKLIGILFLMCSSIANAHFVKDSLQGKELKSLWTVKNNASLFLTENAFINWNAGGNNSIAGIVKIQFIRNYKNDHMVWSNEMKTNYGLNKQAERELRKSEDLFEINSTFGYRKDTATSWYTSAKFNFKTQFTNGYNYPNKTRPKSKIFAPAYMYIGVGSEYTSKKKKLKLYISPMTNKTTYVLDRTLANQGAFGVTKAIYDKEGNILSSGDQIKMEFGTLLSGKWEKLVMDNIKMTNKLRLYSDYINNFGNIDFDWELNLDLTINKYIKANVGTHIIYDDDIKTKSDVDSEGNYEIQGAKIQLKQLLGVGLSYSF
ncbi:MAG: hypothetical protein COB98_04465 [Flavobacteriaceae bacterium]|nr:MAG: hypothetical protein COB98_04465 [Flavobacteriaceae bacterium]